RRDGGRRRPGPRVLCRDGCLHPYPRSLHGQCAAAAAVRSGRAGGDAMKRLLPHPILSGLLLILWLLLQQSAGLGHILLGGVIAILAGLVTSAILPELVTVRRPLKVAQLIVVAGLDIIRSNLAVFWVLLQRRPKPTSGFIEMPLELTN